MLKKLGPVFNSLLKRGFTHLHVEYFVRAKQKTHDGDQKLPQNSFCILEVISFGIKFLAIFIFLAPLAVGQRAYVMALCPSCVRPSVRPSVNFFFKHLLR